MGPWDQAHTFHQLFSYLGLGITEDGSMVAWCCGSESSGQLSLDAALLFKGWGHKSLWRYSRSWGVEAKETDTDRQTQKGGGGSRSYHWLTFHWILKRGLLLGSLPLWLHQGQWMGAQGLMGENTVKSEKGNKLLCLYFLRSSAPCLVWIVTIFKYLVLRE